VRHVSELCASSNFDSLVVYGWSSDVLGFLVEKVSGQTLEQFWYATYKRSGRYLLNSFPCYSLFHQQGKYLWTA